MTDPHADAQSFVSAVASATGHKPCWDLAAPEVGFPIRVERGGKEYEVYAVLAQPYNPDKLIEAITKNRGGYKRTASKLETVVGDDALFSALTDDLFVRLDGTSPTDRPTQLKFLEGNFKLKVRLTREGLGGIVLDREPAAEQDVSEPFSLLPLSLDVTSEVVIPVHQFLWDPRTCQKVDVKMQHILRPETEKDWRLWSRTSSETFTKQNSQWTDTVNWWDRLKLYDQMILRLQGMVMGSDACTEANREYWLPRVPAWHKLLVIGEVFDEAAVKN